MPEMSKSKVSSTMFTGGHIVIKDGIFVQTTSVPLGDKRGFNLLTEVASPSAFHNAGHQHNSLPLLHAVLDRIKGWICDTSAAPLMWLYGPAAVGKSSLARSIAMWCEQESRLLSSFFFSRSDPSRDNILRFIPTLAYTVVQVIPESQCMIEQAIEADPHIFSRSLEAQFSRLILRPLSTLAPTLDGGHPLPHVIVIDGLDECHEAEQKIVLQLFGSTLSLNLGWKVLITSRPENAIRLSFDNDFLQCTRLELQQGENAPTIDIPLVQQDLLGIPTPDMGAGSQAISIPVGPGKANIRPSQASVPYPFRQPNSQPLDQLEILTHRDEIIDPGELGFKAIRDPLDLSYQGFRSARKLDLVFIQDTTGRQTPYIKASVACCKDVCSTLKQSVLLKKDDGLRLGLLAFRDHRDDYIVKDFGGFTDNVNTVVSNLNTLTASGGGDGPKAITSALNKALQLDWRDDSVKVAILITDVPPHGIGERGDSYSGGEPGQLDLLYIAQQLVSRNIALIIIACEPTLSNGYHAAHDFYMALAQKAGGSMLPLSNIHLLAPLIVGFSLEQIDIDSLASQFEELVLEGHREGMDEEKITNSLLNVMQKKPTKDHSLVPIPVYSEPEDADKYNSIRLNASDTLSARNKLKQDNVSCLACTMEVEPIQYRLYVLNASGIDWDIQYKDPNPFIEIFLNGNSIYTTTTKSRTLAPVWNECVELQSSDPTSLLSFKLCHRKTSGYIGTIGSRKVTVKDLDYLANRGGSLLLDDNHTEIRVVLMKKRPAAIKKAAHTSPSPSPSPEPCPDSESPRQPSEPEEIPQVVEFREQDFS